MLSQLEHALAMTSRQQRHTASAGDTETQTRLANLEFQNQRLRNARKQAATRLEVLIETLTRQQEETPAAEDIHDQQEQAA